MRIAGRKIYALELAVGIFTALVQALWIGVLVFVALKLAFFAGCRAAEYLTRMP